MFKYPLRFQKHATTCTVSVGIWHLPDKDSNMTRKKEKEERKKLPLSCIYVCFFRRCWFHIFLASVLQLPNNRKLLTHTSNFNSLYRWPRVGVMWCVIHALSGEAEEWRGSNNGGLGSCGDSGGAVRFAESGIAVSASGEGQSGGVWEHADKWGRHFSSHHHLLRPHHHLSHRYWCSYLHWIVDSDTQLLTSFLPSLLLILLCLVSVCFILSELGEFQFLVSFYSFSCFLSLM